MRRELIKICCCMGMCLILSFCGGCREKEPVRLTEVTEDDTKELEEPEEISTESQFIYICGAVKEPGVYELPAGSRMYEAIKAAGGMTAEADQTYLNQAELVEDGQKIYVPTQEETVSEGKTAEDTDSKDGKINLNTATAEDLQTLTGIGEAKAKSILKYREEHGGFQKVEEIMNIEGIKSGVFNKIKDQIFVK